MAHRRITESETEQIIPRRFARALVVNGQVVGTSHVFKTEVLRDDLGRELAGTVADDGRVELAEPTTRRIFFTGWVH